MDETRGQDMMATDVELDRMKADIAETRARLTTTLNAIEQRLTMTHLAQATADKAARTAGNLAARAERTATDVVRQIRHTADHVRRRRNANAISGLVAALGVGWLLYRRIRGRRARSSSSAWA
jgi:hypothetical protein